MRPLPADAPQLPGYRLLGEIGRGGFGAVFLAEQERLGGLVAIKSFAPHRSELNAPRFRERFRREARLLAQLRGNSHIVQVIDLVNDVRGDEFIVMEYVAGLTVGDIVRRAGTQASAVVARIGREAAAGLAAAHQLGIIHRDIKPENIIIGAGDPPRVRVMDFGISSEGFQLDSDPEEGGAASPARSRLTRTRDSFGTPHYMPIEQLYGARNADERSDVYSLGVVMYSALAGRVPFDDDNPYRLAEMIRDLDPTPLPELVPDVAPGLCAIVARAMAKLPEHRFQTMEELGTALSEIEQGLSTTGTPYARTVFDPTESLFWSGRGVAPSPATGRYATTEDEPLYTVDGHNDADRNLPARRDAAPPSPRHADVPARFEQRTLGQWISHHASPRRHPFLIPLLFVALLAGLAGGWYVTQRARSAPPPGSIERTISLPTRDGEGVAMTFVWIPAGEFTMGSPPHEEERFGDEGPQTQVTLTRGFWLAQTETTQRQWEAIMTLSQVELRGIPRDDPEVALVPAIGPNRPIHSVTWYEARAFCEAAASATSHTFRLPTEAEWEYAARAGRDLPFSFGSTVSHLLANYDSRMVYGEGEAYDDPPMEPIDVASYNANRWNLYDMNGNVWEWTDDWFVEYPGGRVVDWHRTTPPDGMAEPSIADLATSVDDRNIVNDEALMDGPMKVARGGSFLDHPRGLRSAFRAEWPPSFVWADIGFRVVLDAPPPPEARVR